MPASALCFSEQRRLAVVYLTWGEYDGTHFEMFRRAKLLLSDVPHPHATEVVARIHLTDPHGMPRCARLHPPALEFG